MPRRTLLRPCSIIQSVSEDDLGDRIAIEIRRLAWPEGLTDAAFAEIVSEGELVRFEVADVVHRADQPMTSVYVIVFGRLKATVSDQFGNERLSLHHRRGGVLGLVSIALPD